MVIKIIFDCLTDFCENIFVKTLSCHIQISGSNFLSMDLQYKYSSVMTTLKSVWYGDGNVSVVCLVLAE